MMSQNVSPQRHLRPEQRKAVEALATGATIDQAAIVSNRTKRTVYRWLAEDPEFQKALQEATSLAITDTARRLAGTLDLAMTALRKMLEKPGVKDVDRLRAVNLTLSHAQRLIELADIERRIAKLEEALDESHQR